MSQYTVSVEDAGELLPAGTRTRIANIAEVVLQYLDQFIDWHGVMDARIDIKSHAQQVADWGVTYDGWTPATMGSWVWDGSAWQKSNLFEATTGNDLNGAEPDLGLTVYLAQDGSLRIYGDPVWLDPNPRYLEAVQVPSGHDDFFSVVLHEFMHSLAFDGASSRSGPFGRSLVEANGQLYFQGETVLALLGQGLPINADSHILADFAPYAAGGLMRSYGLYEQNRWDIGQIELAVMKDLGWDVNSRTSSLPLADLNDASPNVTGTSGAESVIGDHHDNVLDGGAGNDNLEGGAGTDTARLHGNRGEYTITRTASGYTVSGTDGTDTLSGIERLNFDNQSLNLGQLATSGDSSIVGAYFALFGRAPEPTGYQYWQGQLGSTFSTLGAMIDNWLTLSVVQANGYPAGQTEAEFVRAIYLNVFDKEPDDGGYWAGLIPARGRGTVVADMLAAAQGVPAGTAGKAYVDNKISAATLLVNAQYAYGADMSLTDLTTLLDEVSATASTIQAAADHMVQLLGTSYAVAGLAGSTSFTDTWLS